MLESVTVEKLVHGGQGLGTLADGRKVLVWNAIPGEKLKVRLIKSKLKYAEAIAEEILLASSERIKPKDAAYLSTSPWQIMSFDSENSYKAEILAETLARQKVEYSGKIEFKRDKFQWKYRTKMEYSFWADDNGLHLALFNRGTHNKQIVTGSSIARPEIDAVASNVSSILNKSGIRGSQLKTVIIRCNQVGDCVVGLFVKDDKFPYLKELGDICSGLKVVYSSPKSPASIVTTELYKFGNDTIMDDVMGTSINYDVNSFFQVNLPVFKIALGDIKSNILGMSPIIDMYGGVGAIGIPIGADAVIEIDSANIQMAKLNKGISGTKIIKSSVENSLEHITGNGVLVVDPPRAGLHQKVTDRILESKPEKLIYLSCNPVTQARDLAYLSDIYNVESVTGYNFFPKTPHIESLAVMIKKS